MAVRQNLHPIAHRTQSISADTKLLVNIFTGGKIAASPVKFAHFYLICDGQANLDVSVPAAFRAFLAHLKTKFTVGKGGDSPFKVMPDGSYFNAYPSINDSLKFLEESIAVSSANGSRPATNQGSTGRAGTALSGKSKRSDAQADAADVTSQQAPRNVFQIGVNCDAESLFNKDPKDPNKYEIEGVKVQSTSQQLIEYYVKLCQDHPLITYVEDPFAEADMEGYRKFKEALQEAGLGHVKIGMKHIFRSSLLSKVQDVTSVRPLTAEEQKAEEDAREEEAKRPPTQELGKGKAAAASNASKTESYKGPNHDKFIPHCVSLRTSPLSTVSDLFDFWRYSASLSDEQRFSIIIDDQVNQEVQSELDCSVVDLGIGLGCEFVLVRGCAKPERLAKIQHYGSYMSRRQD